MATSSQQHRAGPHQGSSSSRASTAAAGSQSSDGGSRRAVQDAGNTSTESVRLSLIAGAARVTETAGVTKVVWSELLAYISYYRNCSNVDALRQVILGFFSPADITDGKKLMVQEFQSLEGVGQFITERRNSTARSAHEAELDDVLGIFDVGDAKQAVDGYLFVASRFDLLPKFGPEEVNLGVVVERQVKMEATIQSLSTSVQQLASSGSANNDVAVQQTLQSFTQDIDRRLGEFSAAVRDRLDHLHAVCTQLTDNVTAATSSTRVRSPPPAQSQQQNDRSMNVVVFGVAEDRSAQAWRNKVDDALLFIAGHNVDVADTFRVGRYDANKVRPIVVKLRTAWDWRIILANCNKLKNYGTRLFVAPDESLDVRRKRMFDRIKSHAERDGKIVAVDNGVLSVDGAPVFSLIDGKLPRNG